MFPLPPPQLQSQVMVLGETATMSHEKTSVCLDRLAGLEVRIGSIPVVSEANTPPPYLPVTVIGRALHRL